MVSNARAISRRSERMVLDIIHILVLNLGAVEGYNVSAFMVGMREHNHLADGYVASYQNLEPQRKAAAPDHNLVPCLKIDCRLCHIVLVRGSFPIPGKRYHAWYA